MYCHCPLIVVWNRHSRAILNIVVQQRMINNDCGHCSGSPLCSPIRALRSEGSTLGPFLDVEGRLFAVVAGGAGSASSINLGSGNSPLIGIDVYRSIVTGLEEGQSKESVVYTKAEVRAKVMGYRQRGIVQTMVYRATNTSWLRYDWRRFEAGAMMLGLCQSGSAPPRRRRRRSCVLNLSNNTIRPTQERPPTKDVQHSSTAYHCGSGAFYEAGASSHPGCLWPACCRSNNSVPGTRHGVPRYTPFRQTVVKRRPLSVQDLHTPHFPLLLVCKETRTVYTSPVR